MKKLTVLLILFLPLFVFSQDFLKEEDSFYDNGQAENVTYKNFDLEIFKKETYSPSGKILSSYNYDPKTGKRDGDFFDLDNKGYYKQGVLNCDKYTIALEGDVSGGTGKFWSGKIKDGRPVGKVVVYSIKEKTEVADTKLDPEMSYYASLDAGRRINLYRAVYRSLGFETKTLSELNYNNKGSLEGEQKLNSLIYLYYNSGKLDGIIVKNENNLNKAKDSVFRNNKLWKVDNKFTKNVGSFPVIVFSEFDPSKIKQGVTSLFNSKNSVMESAGRLDKHTWSTEAVTYEYNNPLPFVNKYGMFENIGESNNYSNSSYYNLLYPATEGLPYSKDNDRIVHFPNYFNFLNDFKDSEIYTEWSDVTYYDTPTILNPFPKLLFYYNINNTTGYLSESFKIGKPDAYLDRVDFTSQNFLSRIKASKTLINCSVIEYINTYIGFTDLAKENKNKLYDIIKNLECDKEIPFVSVFDILIKIKETKLVPFSDIFVYNKERKNYESLFPLLKNAIAEVRLKNERDEKIEIEREKAKLLREKAAEISYEKSIQDFQYTYDDYEILGEVLLVDFLPRKNQKQIVHDAICDEVIDVLPMGCEINNSSVDIIVSDRLNQLDTNSLNNLKADLSDEKKLSKLLKKINKRYSRYDEDRFYGITEDDNSITKPNLTISKLNIKEFEFDSETIISSWLRNHLLLNPLYNHFPEESFFYSGRLVPNRVAIFQDPKYKKSIVHLFFYNYGGKITYKPDKFESYSGDGPLIYNKMLESRSERYTAIMMKIGNFWNSNHKEVYLKYEGSTDSDNKLNLTARDFNSSLRNKIITNPLLKDAYERIFDIDIDSGGLFVDCYIYGDYAIPYLNLPRPD